MHRERVYSEREVAEMISRAIEHQKAEAHPEPEHGLTLREIEQVSAEAGIRPEYLRRAAAELDLRGDTAEHPPGPPAWEVHTTRWIPGRLSETDVETMCAELKNHLGSNFAWWGNTGDEVKRLGRTYEWNHPYTGTRVTVTDHGDGYSLRVFRRQFFSGTTAETIGFILTAGFMLGIIPAGAIGEAYGVLWAVLILSIACAIAAAVVPRTITRTRARKADEVEALADAAHQLLLEATDASDAPLRAPDPPLSLPDEDSVASDTESSNKETGRSGLSRS